MPILWLPASHTVQSSHQATDCAFPDHGRPPGYCTRQLRRTSVKTPIVRMLPLTFLFVLANSLRAEPPRTVAEKSDYKATSRQADVMDFCQQLAKESKLVRLGELGTSNEG